MWRIARDDTKYGEGFFALVWAYRKRDLPTLAEVRATSGFVGPNDRLVILRPDSTIAREET